MYPDPEVQQAVDRFQMGIMHSPAAGRSGELLGRGAGSSLEFQEYRQYMPGDDIRHLDWGAYARTDTLMVRLFREEISPRTEVVVDWSCSMSASGEAKPRLTRQLAALFALLAGKLGGQPRVLPIGDDAQQEVSLASLARLAQRPFDGRSTLFELLRAGRLTLKKRSVRIVVSDFLFPHDPELLVKKLATDASQLWLIQVLGTWEADPTPLGGRRLIEQETGEQGDLVIDRKSIAKYRERLKTVQDELLKNARRVHAGFACLIAEQGLLSNCRDHLIPAGMLRVT